MEAMLMLFYLGAAFACIGIGFAGIGFFVSALTNNWKCL